MSELPNLVTAAEAVEKLTGFISKERLLELTEAGYAPHWKKEGLGASSEPYYHLPTLRKYIADNLLVEHKGIPFPKVLPVFIPAPMETIDRSLVPKSLTGILHSLECLDITGYPPAVYFLCLGKEVVYVGQSVNVVSRLITHRRDKEFDRVYYLRTPQEDLENVEAAFIVMLQPKYNGEPSKRRVLTDVHLSLAHIFNKTPTAPGQ